MKSSSHRKRGFGRRTLSAALAVTLAIGLTPVLPAFAQTGADGQFAATPLNNTTTDELPIWAQDTGEDAGTLLSTQADKRTSQRKFDMRTDLKPSPLNPVRTQSPYASCWSFGGIAAAETSIMSDFGEKNLDLSEKHLLWFAMHPISKYDDPAQAGEGVHVFGEDKNRNAAYIPSNPILVSTLFSSGVGPVPESMFPYQGKNGLTEYDFVKNQPKAWKDRLHKNLLKTYGSEKNLLSQIKSLTEHPTVESYLNAEYKKAKTSVAKKEVPNCYSDKDDWTVSTLDSSGNPNRSIFSGYTLTDGNLMPAFTKTTKGKTVPNKEGVLAIKQEIVRGHGVTCALRADTAKPGQESTARYINTKNWAHYTYDEASPNHAVCIIGWDDDYPKEKFNQGVDATTKANRAPAGNGAWIARNSWGSKDGCGKTANGQTIGQDSWGENGSGYFYISYYDKSLTRGETFKFSDDLDGKEFYAQQYDYMPATDQFLTLTSKSKKDLIATSNVFTAEANEQIVSVSTRTSTPNSRVTFAVYRLNKNAKNPEDGQLLEKQSCNIGYAGFHRITLKNPFYIRKGEKFSVISSIAVDDDDKKVYQIAVSTAYGKEKARKANESYYCKATVNKGESYLYRNGKWFDWSNVRNSNELAGWLKDAGKSGDVVDNFNIKAFGLAWDGVHVTHNWDAGKVTKPASPDAAGVFTFTCAKCGAKHTKPIPALPGGAAGKSYKVDGNTYKITSNDKNTVELKTAKKAKSASVPDAVRVKGKKYVVTSVAPNAFASSKNELETVTIGKNVQTINEGAFAGCVKLRAVKGGASLKTVGAQAFANCKALSTCEPLSSKSLTSICASALKDCKKLSSFTVKSKKLTMKGVNAALAGSSVKTIRVNVGNAKTNAAYAKKYAEFFAKANCGKKVAVKA